MRHSITVPAGQALPANLPATFCPARLFILGELEDLEIRPVPGNAEAEGAEADFEDDGITRHQQCSPLF